MESIVIFAAGKGSRMKEITHSTPKPLIQIKGKPLLQYALELTKQYKFDRVFINTHHLAEQIHVFVKQFRESNPDFPEIIVEHEPVLLDTGGTVKKLTKLYDLGERIFALNSDIIIRPEGNIFETMLHSWNELSPDMLLLVQEMQNTVGYTGNGDYNLESDYSVNRNSNPPYKYIFTGLRICNPGKIAGHPGDIFSFQEYFPQQGSMGDKLKVRAIPMQGQWYHATHREDIKEIEEKL